MKGWVTFMAIDTVSSIIIIVTVLCCTSLFFSFSVCVFFPFLRAMTGGMWGNWGGGRAGREGAFRLLVGLVWVTLF